MRRRPITYNLCYDSRLLPSEIECVIYLLISTCITHVVYTNQGLWQFQIDKFDSIQCSTWNKSTGFPTIIIIYNSASVVILYRIRLKHIFFNISEYIHILCTHFVTHWNIYYRHYNIQFIYMYDVRITMLELHSSHAVHWHSILFYHNLLAKSYWIICIIDKSMTSTNDVCIYASLRFSLFQW